MLRVVFLAAFLTLPGAAYAASVADRVSASLNATTTVETDFVQYNSDGSISRGVLQIARPGKMRMEYDTDSGSALVLVGSRSLGIFDGKHDRDAEQYPVARTPLWSILKPNVNLAQDGVLIHQSESGAGLEIWLQDERNPEGGFGHFVFDPDTVQLAEFTITNEMGDATRVVLGKERAMGHRLPASMFSITFEEQRRGGRTD